MKWVIAWIVGGFILTALLSLLIAAIAMHWSSNENYDTDDY